jgi:hypothetical protein
MQVPIEYLVRVRSVAFGRQTWPSRKTLPQAGCSPFSVSSQSPYPVKNTLQLDWDISGLFPETMAVQK